MRFIPALFAARTPAREPVPFKEILPLRLKPFVSGKGEKTSNVCCIYEMSVLFACLKDNEFNQGPCNKEIQNFQKCYDDYLMTSQAKKQKKAKGILDPGEKKLSPKQTNTLLKKFPTFK